MQYAEITGWGKAIPPVRLSNEELATFVETSDEWITSRTGIKERRISHVSTADLATKAAQQAIDAAGLEATDIDLIVIATSCPDTIIPSTASLVQKNLGATDAAAFDLTAACTGFIYALQNATAQIRIGAISKAVVIGAERMSWYLNWGARETCVLFGDGAGAVVLEASDEPLGLVEAKIGCDTKARDILKVPSFGTQLDLYTKPCGPNQVDFVGPEIFKRAVVGMSRAAETVMQRTNLEVSDINLMVPHQANLRIIASLQQKFKLKDEQVMVNIDRYGNTSAATVPIALCEAVEQGRVKPGDNIITAAFGAGLTYGAGLIRWGQRVTPIRESEASLPDCDKTARELLQTAISYCQAAVADKAE